jgi:hypothetical protein
MDAAILDLIRRWLRRFGVLGVLASAAFGIYVELPVAQHAAASEIQALTKSIERQWQRNLRQTQASERGQARRHLAAHRVRRRSP